MININIIDNLIEKAQNGLSKLNIEVLSIEGMSSAINRHLLNNLGNEFNFINYLEIGVWQGSLFVSSLFKNNVNQAWAIDNWSQFENQKARFESNCKRNQVPYNLIESNCFTVDVKKIRDINFYLYDGDHWSDKQTKSLTYFYDSLANEFLYIVDDYDWIGVREGTEQGIKECNLKVEYYRYLESNIGNNTVGWWNGLGIFKLRK